MGVIDVRVVSDCAGTQRDIRQWLSRDNGFNLVGGRGPAASANASMPTVTVWDLGPDDRQARGLACPALAEAAAASRVLALARDPDDATFARVLALGLWGCLDAAEAEASLADAVHAVARGELWLPRRALSQAYVEMNRLHAGMADNGAALSTREREIMVWVARGLMNKEIAQRLGISDKTVKTHLQRIFKKTRLHHRAQLAAQALQ